MSGEVKEDAKKIYFLRITSQTDTYEVEKIDVALKRTYDIFKPHIVIVKTMKWLCTSVLDFHHYI